MKQQNPTDESETLTIAEYRIQNGISLENIKQWQLSHAKRSFIVIVVGERSTDVHKDRVLMLRQVLQNVLIRHVEIGKVCCIEGWMVLVELISEHQPDVASLCRRNSAFYRLQEQPIVRVERSRRLTYVIFPHLVKFHVAWYDFIVVQFHPSNLVLILTLLKSSILLLHSKQEDNLFTRKFPQLTHFLRASLLTWTLL